MASGGRLGGPGEAPAGWPKGEPLSKSWYYEWRIESRKPGDELAHRGNVGHDEEQHGYLLEQSRQQVHPPGDLNDAKPDPGELPWTAVLSAAEQHR
jgi:hypothetical protein